MFILRTVNRWCLIVIEALLGIIAGLALKRITGEHFETATWLPPAGIFTERMVESDLEDGFDSVAEVSSSGNIEDL